MAFTQEYRTPVGPIWITEEGGAITSLGFSPPVGALQLETPLLRRAASQLFEYFDGRRREFDLPLSLCGTAFQAAVWGAISRIPYGRTRTYGEIAAEIGKARSCRAVGAAAGANPIAIVIPCHRVVASGGRLGGYAGGLSVKRALLELEGHPVR